MDVSPRQDGDTHAERGASGVRVKVGEVGKVQGARVTDKLATPRRVETADIASLGQLRHGGGVLAGEADGTARAI